MKSLFLTSFALIFSLFTLQAQNTFEEQNTIEQQFDKIYRTSTNYQIYKVIKKERFLKLKANITDSLKSLKKEISKRENILNQKNQKIESLNAIYQQTKKELNAAISKENNISFFGTQLSKGLYKTILWGIITLLTFGFFTFVYKYNNSNILTNQAKNNLISTEREFDIFRKKSIEREQKLRRELLDEINKHKK